VLIIEVNGGVQEREGDRLEKRRSFDDINFEFGIGKVC